ncbi:stalk domain-containing protein [Paenibacillus sp.]|jgi:exopolysaccharide biosynthesis protein|uniref:stalk domain-containing protein n=1 Tax=Paenibacillus sp. TaxID=58172 RepID=UPI00282FFC91|nr:stalk domain-containing protein [Paenibacillus sp.]MDR0268726.1 phosphodiester glycosidase family protein [Paenibacillus sp.]
MKWNSKKNGNKQGVSGKKWMVVSLAGLLFIAPVVGSGIPLNGYSISSVASAAASSVTKLGEEPVTSGANMIKYKFTTTRSGKQASALADVIRIDLQNPYVKMDVMTGKNGQFTTKQSTGGMAKDTGAVAGVNGDYFNTGAEGAPIGGQVTNGQLLSTPSDIKGMYSFAVTNSGKPIIDEFAFSGSVTAEDGSSFPLAGMNKTSYNPESSSQTYSHIDAMYIYTSAWKSTERPKNSATTPIEVLVQNDVITQISDLGGFVGMAVPQDGYILRTHGKAAEFMKSHMAVGQKLKTSYMLNSKTMGKSVDPASLQMMIGGHTILVNSGQTTAFSRDVSSIGGYRARTALGYSKDERYAYIVTVEKNDNSSGMSLSELQTFMINIGVWKGMNLDGGGSTTMVSRPLGDTDATLTFNTEYGTDQRSVVNGVGVYTSAPKGQLKGLNISGSSSILIGQQATFKLKGYDNYYNPVDTSSVTPTLKSSNGNIQVSGQTVTGVKPGTSTITAISGQASSRMEVKVLGADDLNELNVGSATGSLKAGSTISVPVSATTKNGQKITVPESALKWEFIGFKGSVQNGKLTVSSVNNNAKVGYAIARYNGYSTAVVLSAAGEAMWENFENVSYPVNFTTNNPQVKGTAAVTQGTGDHANSKVLQLTYDMTAGTGKMYAYAELNGSTGKTIAAPATTMSIDMMGDHSLNWARAELKDNNGNTVYVDLAKAIDWDGWKTIQIDLSDKGIAFPAQLKRLYVVNVEEGQDERAMTGTVAFDNIKFTMPSLSSDAGLPTGKVMMTIGQKSFTANGTKKTMEVAPVMKDNSTYIPIKYVLDTFGGQATWDPANQRITVTRGGTVMDLMVGKKDFILNGKRKGASVAPYLSQGRTLVPLRLVSEQLGLNVKWEQNTKTVTIES